MPVLHPIPIPYNLEEKDLVLDDAATGSDLDTELKRLTKHGIEKWLDQDEVVEIILRAAILLKDKLGDEASLADCLHTASIWYYG